MRQHRVTITHPRLFASPSWGVAHPAQLPGHPRHTLTLNGGGEGSELAPSSSRSHPQGLDVGQGDNGAAPQ